MKKVDYSEADVPEQTGKVFFVTGANTGIGFETARILAERNARVLLGCRSEREATVAVNEIRLLNPSADVAWVPLDLASLHSISNAAEIVRCESRLDGLINNAGVMMPPLSQTEDGFELQFGVNHLGHFALTGLLLSFLMARDSARIATVSSLAHRRGEIDYQDIHAKGRYSRLGRYQMSKLANILFMLELHRRLQSVNSSVLSVASHPGAAATDLGRHTFIEKAFVFFRPLFNSPLEGALPTLLAVTGEAVEGGHYYGPQGFLELRHSASQVQTAKKARNEANAARLWDISEALTRVEYDFGAIAG